MPRQTKNSRSRLEELSQTTPSLLGHQRREVATSPIRMAENKEFNKNDNGGEDNVNGNKADNKDATVHVPKLPELIIPDGVDAATAYLLKMQMTMMQILMTNQRAQMERRLDYETRERQLLARKHAKNCWQGTEV
jgi:hypothetical protein